MADISQILLPNGNTYNIKDKSALPLSGGTVTGTLKTDNSIQMFDGKNYVAPIKVYDDGDNYNYGSELVIAGNGNVFIGGGEAPTNVRTDFLNGNLKDGEIYNRTGEHTYITSDQFINFLTNCQTASDRKGMLIDNNGTLKPYVNNGSSLGTNASKWNEIYGSSYISDNKFQYVGSTNHASFLNTRSNFEKGTNPSSTVYWNFNNTDKVSETSHATKNRLGLFETYVDANGNVGTRISAYKNEKDSTASSMLTAVYAADGTTYATAPTPSNANDNSTKIATTAWVNTHESSKLAKYLPLDSADGGKPTIVANADLNTATYLELGTYSTGSANAATLKNCPTKIGFRMDVTTYYNGTKKVTTDTYVYRFRKITDVNGNQWFQQVQSGATANKFTYGTWDKYAMATEDGNIFCPSIGSTDNSSFTLGGPLSDSSGRKLTLLELGNSVSRTDAEKSRYGAIVLCGIETTYSTSITAGSPTANRFIELPDAGGTLMIDQTDVTWSGTITTSTKSITIGTRKNISLLFNIGSSIVLPINLRSSQLGTSKSLKYRNGYFQNASNGGEISVYLWLSGSDDSRKLNIVKDIAYLNGSATTADPTLNLVAW